MPAINAAVPSCCFRERNDMPISWLDESALPPPGGAKAPLCRKMTNSSFNNTTPNGGIFIVDLS